MFSYIRFQLSNFRNTNKKYLKKLAELPVNQGLFNGSELILMDEDNELRYRHYAQVSYVLYCYYQSLGLKELQAEIGAKLFKMILLDFEDEYFNAFFETIRWSVLHEFTVKEYIKTPEAMREYLEIISPLVCDPIIQRELLNIASEAPDEDLKNRILDVTRKMLQNYDNINTVTKIRLYQCCQSFKKNHLVKYYELNDDKQSIKDLNKVMGYLKFTLASSI